MIRRFLKVGGFNMVEMGSRNLLKTETNFKNPSYSRVNMVVIRFYKRIFTFYVNNIRRYQYFTITINS